MKRMISEKQIEKQIRGGRGGLGITFSGLFGNLFGYRKRAKELKTSWSIKSIKQLAFYCFQDLHMRPLICATSSYRILNIYKLYIIRCIHSDLKKVYYCIVAIISYELCMHQRMALSIL